MAPHQSIYREMFMKFKPLTQAISLSLIAASTAYSAEFVVQTTGDSGSGTPNLMATDVFEIDTLRSAVEAANDEINFPGPDEIRFDSSLYSQGSATINIDAVGDTFSYLGSMSNSGLAINSEISVKGSTDNQMILEAGDLRHFQVNSGGRLSLQNLTIQGGFAPDNIAGKGGAILVLSDASLDLSDSIVTDNVAQTGGAINLRQNSNTSFIRSTLFTNNSTTGSSGSGTGAAIAVFTQGEHALYVYDSTFTQNSANYSGGALFTGGNLVVSGSTINNNFANRGGGGIDTNNIGILTLLNSTVSGNTANAHGGGVNIGTTNGTSLIVNSTVTNNVSDADGVAANSVRGGISIDSSGGGVFSSEPMSFELHNSLVTGNSETMAMVPDDVAAYPAGTSSNNLISVGGSIIGLNNGVNGNQIGSITNPIDAKIQPLADNGGPTLTHLPETNSPAINAGNNTEATNLGLLNDERGTGYPRQLSTVDIGAVELDLIFFNGFDD